MNDSKLLVGLTILRVVLTLVERAFSGNKDAAEKVLSLLPEGELKTTTVRTFAEAQVAAKFPAGTPG